MSDATDKPRESDAELVARAQKGDERAFNEIVGRFSAKVISLCTYYVKNPAEGYDLSQEVFLKVYRGLGSFRGDAKLSTWIHTIAVNTCRNHVSFWKRLLTRKTAYDADPSAKPSTKTPEEVFLKDERARIVRQEIEALPPKYREILILKDMQDCSYEEIAEVLGLNPGTVKSRLHRAREALAQRLERVIPPNGGE